MRQYLDLIDKIIDEGVDRGDRTGTGTRSIFGHQLRFNLEFGFPLLTTKRIHTKSVFAELLWFISGSSNVRDLQEYGVTIWDEWAEPNGDLGPIYGSQWRSWWPTPSGKFIDQLGEVIEDIQTDPNSRRHVVSAWNVGQLDEMALPPCHLLYQFYVANGRLSCSMYQRSVDVFLGLPFNIASYAALTQMVAQVTGYKPGELIMSLGDTHLYHNHFEQAELQLKRVPRGLPVLLLNPEVRCIDDFTLDDLQIIDYNPHATIKARIAV